MRVRVHALHQSGQPAGCGENYKAWKTTVLPRPSPTPSPRYAPGTAGWRRLFYVIAGRQVCWLAAPVREGPPSSADTAGPCKPSPGRGLGAGTALGKLRFIWGWKETRRSEGTGCTSKQLPLLFWVPRSLGKLRLMLRVGGPGAQMQALGLCKYPLLPLLGSLEYLGKLRSRMTRAPRQPRSPCNRPLHLSPVPCTFWGN